MGERNMLIRHSNLISGKKISITGYRHASNLLLAVSVVLPQTKVILNNLPNLVDTEVMLQILHYLGASVSAKNNAVEVSTKHSKYRSLHDSQLCEQIHGSVYMMPAMLARFGQVEFGRSGGCQIGSSAEGGDRPIEHILEVMKAFGATIVSEDNIITATVDKLHAPTVDIAKFSFSKDAINGPLTSGATKTAIILALAIQRGRTVLLNPFLKSEVIDLLKFIKEVGFNVQYDQNKIVIEPHSMAPVAKHHVISDPSEIITYMSLAVYHGISLSLEGITMSLTKTILKPEFDLLRKMGVNFDLKRDAIDVKISDEINACSVDITPQYVCTDHHPFILAILLRAKGISRITEYVWYERFQYIPEMKKLGITLQRHGNTVDIIPQAPGVAAEVLSGHDLRAAALLVIIALAAPCTTRLSNFSHLFRGYEDFIGKLRSLGADIEIEVAQKTISEAIDA